MQFFISKQKLLSPWEVAIFQKKRSNSRIPEISRRLSCRRNLSIFSIDRGPNP